MSDTDDPLAEYDRRMNDPLPDERYPDDFDEAYRLEPHWGRHIAWFRRDHPLGEEGERLLAERNAASERESVGPLDETMRSFLSGLNEQAVREQLGIPQVPTP